MNSLLQTPEVLMSIPSWLENVDTELKMPFQIGKALNLSNISKRLF